MKKLSLSLAIILGLAAGLHAQYQTGCGNPGDNDGDCGEYQGTSEGGGGDGAGDASGDGAEGGKGGSDGGGKGGAGTGKGGAGTGKGGAGTGKGGAGSGKGGNTGKGGAAGQGAGKGANPVNVLRGSLQRSVSDLEIFGSAPFKFGRIYNSRTRDYTQRSWEMGTTYTWQHNWQYEMRESASTAFGFPALIVRYPAGREKYFFATDSSGSVRVSDANWGDRLYPTGTAGQYLLRTPNGRELLFTKTGTGSSYQYLLNEVRDGTGWKWTLTYQTQSDNLQRLYRITNSYGRYLQINRAQVSGTNFWKITSVSSNDGRTVTYGYTTWIPTSENVLSSVTYPGNETATYTWVGANSLTTGAPLLASAVDPQYSGNAGKKTKYTYNYTATYGGTNIVNGTILEEKNYDTNQVIVKLPVGGGTYPQILEGNGTEITRKFASNGSFAFNNVTEEKDGENRKITHTYQTAGGIPNAGFQLSSKDDVNATTSYTPDYAGRVTSRTDAYGKTSYASYNASGFLLSRTDELNRVTTFTRNTSNQVTRIDYPDVSYETFTYSGSGLLKTRRLRSGANEAYTYDSPGNLVTYAITYLNGQGGAGTAVTNTTTYAYFSNGLCSSTTDPRNNTTSYLYDWRGQLTRITFPGGPYRQMAYDNFGNLTSETDELGHIWSKTYTEYNEVATSKDPLNRITSYEYGQEPGCGSCGYRPTLTRITLPSGKRIEYSYDRSGKRISMKTGAGTTDQATTTFAYDLVGNLASLTDPRGKISTAGYDLLHRKTSETDPLLHTTAWTYDDVSNNLRLTRHDTTYTEMTYDTMHRVLTTRNPNNEITSFTYYPDGSLNTLKDARNNIHTFTVDGRSRRTRLAYPGGSYENYTYDAAGNLSVYNARNGVTLTCTYDTRNRDTLCDWSDGTPDVSKTYDNASRLLTLNNANSALAYSYDNANQLLTETQTITSGPGAKNVDYTYTDDGNRDRITYPSGPIYTSRYTWRNQVSRIFPQSNPSLTLVAYTYDLSGNRTAKTTNNGASTTSTYDDANRLTNITQSIGQNFGYTYNTVNNRTSKTSTTVSGPVLTENYSFDAADQLTGTSYLSGTSTTRTAAYTYDAVGNRTSTVDGSLTIPYTANALNQYTAIDSLSAPVYSTNGNLSNVQYPGVAGASSSSVWTYTYDSQNRFLTANNGITSASIAYDARNRQVKRTINGTTTYFVYDGWNLIEEYTGSTLQTSYLHGAQVDEIVFQNTTTTNVGSYYHYDALGNVIALSDTSGALVESYRYDTFGTPSIYNASGTLLTTSTYNNRFLYTGREWLADLAIYDYRNRQYSPQLGRFLQTDPIRFRGQDINLCRYVENIPNGYIDPFGKSIWGEVIESIAGGISEVIDAAFGAPDPLDPKDTAGIVLPAGYGIGCVQAKANLQKCQIRLAENPDTCPDCSKEEDIVERVCNAVGEISDALE